MPPHNTETVVELANNVLKLDDRLLCWVVGCGGTQSRLYVPQLYSSTDGGASWKFFSEIYRDPEGKIAASYPQVIVLPSGRWLGFLGCWDIGSGTRYRWTSVCHSDNEGKKWSVLERIQDWSISPYPVRLSDGRIVAIFMRRAPDPTGLYVIVSEDRV